MESQFQVLLFFGKTYSFFSRTVPMSLFSIDFYHGNKFLMFENIGFDMKFAKNGFLQHLEIRKQVL